MNKMLNYIIKNMKEKNISEELVLIEELLNEGKITINTEIEKNGETIKLKDLLLLRYKKDPFNKETKEFLEKYDLKVKLNGEESYFALMDFLNESRFSILEDLEKSWNKLKSDENFALDEIQVYINEVYLKEPYRGENLYKVIFDSSDSNINFLFNDIIKESIGLENSYNIFNDYVEKNFANIIRKKNEKIIKLLNTNSELNDIENNKGESLVEKLVSNFPDKYIAGIEDEEEKNKWTEWYFKNYFEKENPSISRKSEEDSNVQILLSNKEWYKMICGSEDILSVLIKDEYKKEIILIELRNKNLLLKEHILKRDKNLLIEYLSKNPENALLKEYNILQKRLPELLTRESNSEGVLDSMIDGSIQTLYKTSAFYAFLKTLPSAMLLTGSSDRLLNWANEIPFYKVIGKDKKEKDIYSDLFSLSLSKIDSSFERNKEGGFADPKVEEARIKLCMQRNIRNLIELSYSKIPKQEEVIREIEQFKLPVEKLINFPLIQELISSNRLPEDYLQKLIASKEKEILSESLSSSEKMENYQVNKKRI